MKARADQLPVVSKETGSKRFINDCSWSKMRHSKATRLQRIMVDQGIQASSSRTGAIGERLWKPKSILPAFRWMMSHFTKWRLCNGKAASSQRTALSTSTTQSLATSGRGRAWARHQRLNLPVFSITFASTSASEGSTDASQLTKPPRYLYCWTTGKRRSRVPKLAPKAAAPAHGPKRADLLGPMLSCMRMLLDHVFTCARASLISSVRKHSTKSSTYPSAGQGKHSFGTTAPKRRSTSDW